MADVPEHQAVNIRNRSCSIGALVDIPGSGAEGVLFAHGSWFGGHALYVKDGGVIKLVAVDVSGEPYLDLERQAEAMLARE